MARPQKCRCICSLPSFNRFTPAAGAGKGEVLLGYDEYEVVRLLDYEGFSQERCAERMAKSPVPVAMSNICCGWNAAKESMAVRRQLLSMPSERKWFNKS